MTLFQAFLVLCLHFPPTFAAPRQQPCPMPQVAAASREANIFTPEQAEMLGGIVMQQVSREFKLVGDPALNEYLQNIADRMAEVSGVGKVRVAMIDLPELNAFTFPGARVLLSRKLVSFARTEDELAGVLAHEFGHIVSRDSERAVSAALSTP
ncbi:MAG: M48 family metalloprotease [Acidobacteriia bacterium]|nr:M48 family metalloprotease [Terriglobia bacterium]